MGKRDRESSSSSDSSSSDSEEDRKRSKKDKKDKDRKKDKKKEKKEKKRLKKLKKEKKKLEKKEKKDHKNREKQLLQAVSASSAVPPRSGITPITEENFYDKNSEFRLWLLSKKNVYFDELSASQARSKFAKFVVEWNSGLLDSKLYNGVQASELESNVRTRHVWGFAKNLNSLESSSLRDKVDTLNKRSWADVDPTVSAGPRLPTAGPPIPSSADALADEEERRERMSKEFKSDRKAWQKRQDGVLEELAPKPEAHSFQARMEKRATKGAYTRPEADAAVELSSRDMYGGGKDEFARRLAREKEKQAAKAAVRQEKSNAYAERERATMARLFANLDSNSAVAAAAREHYEQNK